MCTAAPSSIGTTIAVIAALQSRSSALVHTGERLRIDAVRIVAADVSGRLLAVGLASGSIELREAETGVLIAASDACQCSVISLSLSADSRIIDAWEDGQVASLTFDAQ